MSEFIKPKAVNVSDSEYVQALVNVNLRKDLYGDEEVCQHCHGTGMVIVDNIYGLNNDPNKLRLRFPYKHQSLSFCPVCYNGIVHRCKLCGKIMRRGYLKCDCDAQKKIDEENRLEKIRKDFEKAPIAPDDMVKEMLCFFSEQYGVNDGYFYDFDEFFEYWYENCTEDDERPEFVWITEPVEMSIDVQNFIESATEELYEDASDDISSEARKELQDFVDGWCKRCGVGTTYYESHKYKVRIPWEDYDGKRD